MNEYKRLCILMGILVFLLFICILFKEPILEFFEYLPKKLEIPST